MNSSSRCLIVTIDGPAGSGKSTLAKNLADALGLTYIVTGATYRALAYQALRTGVDFNDPLASGKLARSINISFKPPTDPRYLVNVFLNGEDITPQLSLGEVSYAASCISRHPSVRTAMVEIQRHMVLAVCSTDSSSLTGVVVEGRDTGTVVFPDAQVKIFLTANLDERARRRARDFEGRNLTHEQIMEEIRLRDIRDTTREISPLKSAPDAVIIDNTSLAPHQTLHMALEIVHSKIELK
jgi:CMP/dCMP kinase